MVMVFGVIGPGKKQSVETKHQYLRDYDLHSTGICGYFDELLKGRNGLHSFSLVTQTAECVLICFAEFDVSPQF